MKLKHLSGSRIGTYEQCPLKYYAIYEEELPKGEPHPLTNMGSGVHLMFEHATLTHLGQGDCESFEPLWYKSFAMKEENVLPEHFDLVDELTSNAIRWGYFRDMKWCVGAETEVNFVLEDGTKVTGFIDRLDVREPEATVTDLKTQKRAFTPEQLQRNWQARIYNIGARKLYPNVTGKVKVAFWVLRHQVQPIWLTADDAARDEIALMKVADEIRACEDPHGNPSGLCPWCPKHGNCPFEKMGRKARFKRKTGK